MTASLIASRLHFATPGDRPLAQLGAPGARRRRPRRVRGLSTMKPAAGDTPRRTFDAPFRD